MFQTIKSPPKICKSVARDEGGNVAVMTAVSMMALMLCIGVTMDLSSASSRAQQLQDIADGAVLAGASMRDETEDKVKERVRKVVADANKQNWDLDVTVEVVDKEIHLSIATTNSSPFSGITGRKDMPISVMAGSPMTYKKPVHLALVLDTTDSMSGDNLTAMQAAAVELIDEMEDMPIGTRVSVVPFGQYVNVGVTSATPRPWLNNSKDGNVETRCGPSRVTITPATCSVVGTESYSDIRDGVNYGTRTRDKTECTGGVYEDGPEVCNDRTLVWSGCMGSRESGFAETADYQGRKFPAAYNKSCGTEIMPLSQNFNDMRDMINGLTTSGETYLPSGLSWGWRTLDKEQPYTEATVADSKKLNRAMLFMTDGANTRSIGGSDEDGKVIYHDGSDGSKGLEVTETLCAGIKADGIEIFTVAYRQPGQTDTVETLEKCATSPSHFFTPDNAAQLRTSFADIAERLDSTRISF